MSDQEAAMRLLLTYIAARDPDLFADAARDCARDVAGVREVERLVLVDGRAGTIRQAVTQ